MFPLTHQGELVGRLTVSTLPGETLTDRDIGLLEDLGVHIAGLVHGRRLTQDLDQLPRGLDQQPCRRAAAAAPAACRSMASGPSWPVSRSDSGPSGTCCAKIPTAPKPCSGTSRRKPADAVGQVRGLVEGLAPPDLGQNGLVEAIRAGGARIGFGTSLRCVLSIETEDLPVLPAAAELAAYRVAMEALANVARHAATNAAVVRLSLNEALHLEIDDGVGMPMGFVAGVGVTSMRERALEVGGRLVIERRPPGGTRVACVLPVAASRG